MRQCVRTHLPSAMAVFLLAATARADIRSSFTLEAGNHVNFDTGQIVASGGDVLWDGTTFTPQGSATAHNISLNPTLDSGQVYFNAFKNVATSAALFAVKMVVNDCFVVYTNGGHTAAVKITAVGGGSITFDFLTYGAIPLGPQIDSVLNNSSLIPDHTLSSGIAPSSIFIIRGQNLADPGDPVLQSSAAPGLPLTLNGASIAVAVNGTVVHPPIYYTSPTQVAAVLPARTPIGSAQITVTYNGATSAPYTFQVVASAPGINMYYTNTGVATDAVTGAIITFTNSATPGEPLTFWTTGIGANPADSDNTYTVPASAIKVPVQVYVGGILVNPLYSGGSGYPGVDQVNIVVPDSAPTGCWVSVAIVANGVVSNVVTISINRGGGACADPISGLNGNQIAPSGGVTIRGGLVALIQTNTASNNGTRTITNSTDAAFEKYSGIYRPPFSLSPGGCLVTYLTNNVPPIPTITPLDSGAINLTGPNGLNVKLAPQPVKGAFYSLLGADAIPDTGGTYTFTGAGGTDVGHFTSSVTLNNPILKWTNTEVTSNINRSQGVTIKWTGGNPGSYVFILGSTGVAGAKATLVSFTCLTHADDGQFTVPSWVLLALQPGSGAINIQNYIQTPLPASGLDAAATAATIAHSEKATFN